MPVNPSSAPLDTHSDIVNRSAEPLQVEEAVRLALVWSEELRAMEHQVAAERARSEAAGVLPDPEARLSVEALPLSSPRDGEEWLLGASQAIPLGDVRSGERAASAAGVRATLARRDATARRVEQYTRAVHASGLALDAALGLLESRRTLARQRVEREQVRFGIGAVAASEVDGARVELARIEHEIEDAKHAREAQTRALAALLGQDDAQRSLAGDLDEAYSLPELQEVLHGLSGLPLMHVAAAEAALADARIRIASAQRLPVLRLDAGWRERSDGRGSLDLAVGFTIPWSGASSARARAAQFDAAAQRARNLQTERDLVRVIADAYDAAVLALHRLEIHDEVLLPAAQRHLERVRTRVEIGDAAPSDADLAEGELLVARLERLTVWSELSVAWAELGTLLVREP